MCSVRACNVRGLKATIFGLVLVFSGCQGGGESATTQDFEPSSAESAQVEREETEQSDATEEVVPAAMDAFKDDGNVAELEIEGNDRMQFNKERLSALAGQMVRLTLTHTGNLPAQAMGHNVVILNAGEDFYEFGADVGEHGGSAENNFVPPSLRERVVAFTDLIGGGMTATVEFQAPAQPGEYPFICSFPGHFGQMNGIFVIK